MKRGSWSAPVVEHELGAALQREALGAVVDPDDVHPDAARSPEERPDVSPAAELSGAVENHDEPGEGRAGRTANG